VYGAAGGIGDIRPGPPPADAHHSPIAFRILTHPYKDLTPAERERRAKTATPEERALLYPEMHAFRQSMKPKTARGAWVYRVLLTLMLVGGLAMAGYGLVVACTHPNLQDAEGFILGGAVVTSASFQFAAGLAAWDEERQDSTDRDLAPR